jgi:hypothetical protein
MNQNFNSHLGIRNIPRPSIDLDNIQAEMKQREWEQSQIAMAEHQRKMGEQERLRGDMKAREFGQIQLGVIKLQKQQEEQERFRAEMKMKEFEQAQNRIAVDLMIRRMHKPD